MLYGVLRKITVLLISLLLSIEMFSIPIAQNALQNRRSNLNRGRRNRRLLNSRVSRNRRGRRRRRSTIKKIKSIIGENFIITLRRKNVDGSWSIENYSKKLIDLVENRRSVRNTYFIFKPMKKGIGTVKLIFKSRRGIIDREIYRVNILTPREFQASIAQAEARSRGIRTNGSSSANTSSSNATQNNEDNAENTSQEDTERINKQKERNQYELIKNLYTRKAYRETIKEANNFMKKFQQSKYIVDVIITAGRAHGALNEHAKAVSLYSKYIKKVKNPNVTYPVYFARVKSLEKLGKKSAAQVEYIKMLNVFTGKPQLAARTHLLLGKLYIKSNNVVMGLSELEKLVKKYPNQGEITAEAYYYLGRNYYKTRGIEDYEKSYRSFLKLVTNFPNSRFADASRRMARYLKVNYIEYR